MTSCTNISLDVQNTLWDGFALKLMPLNANLNEISEDEYQVCNMGAIAGQTNAL